ncbi:MAG: DUF4864 domain-containing protein [Alphaproteobacteria bacterium]|nr:DUF4864 domain-containing protein [Alphaproteobacteria bacterium]
MPSARTSPSRRSVAALVLALALLLTTTAPRAAELDSPAFRAVIGAQVDAFRRQAWSEAFGYASPSIRTLFGTVDRFRSMVLNGYEAVVRPRVFEFEAPAEIDGRPTQPVFVVGPDGVARRALYFMERQPDGRWLIDGCMLLPIADRTT